ncbi:hypothetical protein MKL09_05105 [Methylobacterium sp. J-048]|uniref:hypothetical protein n=1 Tax=Methylobacterium sp. J-048 TaxID=2836635 RepID=UPI001FB9A535|nr:hypothetical protein [Methylobacterium sp. J-048]MCJ2055927.1 hypothetical protein [Methylobacterium sp. J-048]
MTQRPPEAIANRYSAADIFKGNTKDQLDRFFNSVSGVAFNLVLRNLVSSYRGIQFDLVNQVVFKAHETAATEIGRQALFSMRSAILETDTNFGADAVEYIGNHRAPPVERLTFFEYLLIECYQYLRQIWPRIEESINRFLQASSIRLTYANLQFQPTDSSIIEKGIHEPFWDLVSDGKWSNVRADMQQAFNQRDSGGPDPAFYAARALESAIKIISNLKEWTTGKEKGASNYLDNLVSQKNGRFIAVWEADILKDFFGKLRNPTAHGAGSDEQPRLSRHQAAWVIDFCIIWIKSLVGRL